MMRRFVPSKRSPYSGQQATLQKRYYFTTVWSLLDLPVCSLLDTFFPIFSQLRYWHFCICVCWKVRLPIRQPMYMRQGWGRTHDCFIEAIKISYGPQLDIVPIRNINSSIWHLDCSWRERQYSLDNQMLVNRNLRLPPSLCFLLYLNSAWCILSRGWMDESLPHWAFEEHDI